MSEQHCKYCKGGVEIDADIVGVEVYIAGSSLMFCMSETVFGTDVFITSEVPIKYCPMCGRRLDG